MARRGTEPVCGRLVQDKPYGVTDICGEPSRHSGPHLGKYHGMKWNDHESGRRSGEPKIIQNSRGSNPIHNIPPGGNIRGN